MMFTGYYHRKVPPLLVFPRHGGEGLFERGWSVVGGGET